MSDRRWIIALGLALLLVGLTGLFVVSARTIHLHYRSWATRLRHRLERDADAIIRHLFR